MFLYFKKSGRGQPGEYDEDEREMIGRRRRSSSRDSWKSESENEGKQIRRGT